MPILVPVIVILGFGVVLTVGLISVLQDLSERTAESPLIREEVLNEDHGLADWRRVQPAYASSNFADGGQRTAATKRR